MESQPPSREPRNSKARERQRKRRERQQHVTRMASSSRAPRQTNPEGGFKLPKFRIPITGRMLYYAGGVLILVVVIVVLGFLKDNTVQIGPNAVWIGTEWTYENPEDESVLAFAQKLRENEIGTVYAWVSWLKPDITWAGVRDQENDFAEVEDSVKAFVQQFKQVYPEARLFGWISIPTDTVGIEPRLHDPEVQNAAAAFSLRMIDEFGFDGVFLNVEQVWDGDGDFLDLLRTVRQTLGTDTGHLIAVAVPPDWSPQGVNVPASEFIAPGTVWEETYKQNVALLVDHMAVMAYNSGLTTIPDYVQWTAYQVEAFSKAIDGLGADTELVIGIPTYSAEPPAHDPAVENIPSALEGVELGLTRAGSAASKVRGLAIYASWETDDSEWAQFTNGWVDRP